MAYANLATTCGGRGARPAEALTWAARALELAERLGDTAIAVHARTTIGVCTPIDSGWPTLEEIPRRRQARGTRRAGRARLPQHARALGRQPALRPRAPAPRRGHRVLQRPRPRARPALPAREPRAAGARPRRIGATRPTRPRRSCVSRARRSRRASARSSSSGSCGRGAETRARTRCSTRPGRSPSHGRAAAHRPGRGCPRRARLARRRRESCRRVGADAPARPRSRLGRPRRRALDLAPPRRQRQGAVGAAPRTADEWRALGCPYEAALALADRDDETSLRQALDELQELGAGRGAALVARRLRERGARGLPRGPRPATRQNPAGLTARELEVLALVAEGLRNSRSPTASSSPAAPSTTTSGRSCASSTSRRGPGRAWRPSASGSPGKLR